MLLTGSPPAAGGCWTLWPPPVSEQGGCEGGGSPAGMREFLGGCRKETRNKASAALPDPKYWVVFLTGGGKGQPFQL